MKVFRTAAILSLGALLVPAYQAHASENAPHSMFAAMTDVPQPQELRVGLNYQESEAYYFWDTSARYDVTYRAHGERYGIDINQGYVSFDYGVSERWAVDLAVGYTTVGWRAFSNFSTNGDPQSTTGLMDSTFGLRYQIFTDDKGWKPMMTFRAGAVVSGSFDQHFPFAPGDRSAAIEPELLMRKRFGWPGLGGYLDGLFRWNKTSANDHYIISAGLFQKIQRWELDVGYRHLGSVGGDDIQYDPNTAYINYPRSVRESSDSIDAGFHYITKKSKIKIGFTSRTVFDGVNTDKKFWVGGFVEFPFQFGKSSSEASSE
jgi:hypothetical protein